MDSYTTTEIADNFPDPDQFREKLQTLDSQLSPILADFKKYYVFFNTNPEYPEYQQTPMALIRNCSNYMN